MTGIFDKSAADYRLGLSMLRKWKATDREIHAAFETTVSKGCAFHAIGKIVGLTGNAVQVSGENFDLVCNLRRGDFIDVDRKAETLTLLFEWNDKCLLTAHPKQTRTATKRQK